MTRKSISLGLVVTLVCLVNVRAAVQIEQPIRPVSAESAFRSVYTDVTIWTNSTVPQQDLTVFIVADGDDVITGGPLLYGSQLSAICDITGPDMRDIVALFESRIDTVKSRSIISRLVYTSVPPLAIGTHTSAVGTGAARLFDLWPDAIWILHTPVMSPYERQFVCYMVPEPASIMLIGFGGWVLTRSRRP